MQGGLGEVKFSVLDEALFQQANGANWVLADGRSITGSQLHSLYPQMTVAPDLRGNFIRPLDAGAGIAADQSTTLSFTPDFTTGQITLGSTPAGTLALTTGQIVVLSVTGGSMPTGLTANIRYFVIFVSPTVFQVATTLRNAINGIFVAFTDNGSGTFSAIVSRVTGTFENHQYVSHSHAFFTTQFTDVTGGAGGGGVGVNTAPGYGGTQVNGGNETRPQNVGFYAYIRIN
jgi:hypothetical protein